MSKKHLKEKLDNEIQKKVMSNIDDSTVRIEENVHSHSSECASAFPVIGAEANSENKVATKAHFPREMDQRFQTSEVGVEAVPENEVPLDLSVIASENKGSLDLSVVVPENEDSLDLSVPKRKIETYLIPVCSETEQLVTDPLVLSNDKNKKNIVINPEGCIGTGIFDSTDVKFDFTPNKLVIHSIINIEVPRIEVALYFLKSCGRIFKKSFSLEYKVSPKKRSLEILSPNLSNILSNTSSVDLANYDNSISFLQNPILVGMLNKGSKEMDEPVFYKSLIKKLPESYLKEFFQRIACFLTRFPFSEDRASGFTSEYKATEFTSQDLFNIFTSSEDVNWGDITRANALGFIFPQDVALESTSGEVQPAPEISDEIDKERANNPQTPSKRSSQMLSPSGPRRKSPKKVQSDGDSISESLSRVGFADEKL